MTQFKQGNLILFFALLGAAATIAAAATIYTTLYSFGGMTDNAYPETTLIQGDSGNLFGTTNGREGGTVFKITTSGVLTTLHTFCSQSDCMDGFLPLAELVEGADGNFYGETAAGGSAKSLGTIFKITPAATLTTLHIFHGTEGAEPYGGLVLSTDGNFYGTTTLGGSNGSICEAKHDLACGTVFKITPSGVLTTLYNFCSLPQCADGGTPVAQLAQGTDGNFYGATASHGANHDGTVFKITPDGVLTTLHAFDGTDGEGSSALVEYSDGVFYAITGRGGRQDHGTAYKINSSGTFRKLYDFCCTNIGIWPTGLMLGSDGNFYGTASAEGSKSGGTIFEMNPAGTVEAVYSFCPINCAGGTNPEAPPFQDTNGDLYGTTFGGGAEDVGVVYSFSLGLGRFVRTVPAGGAAETPIRIQGNNLTGASSVTFNGVAATFTVVSATLIKTTVPAGATTGTVQVVTPDGTLSSNVAFQVLP